MVKLFQFYLNSNMLWFSSDMMIKTKWKSCIFFVWDNVRWEVIYGVYQVRLFAFIYVTGCFFFDEVFFPCLNLITLIWLLTYIVIWCNKALYITIDKDVDNNTLMLRMNFCNLRFSQCLFSSSVSSTKRGVLLFSLYVPFGIDTMTLTNVEISCPFLHNFVKAMSWSNFSSFAFFCSKSKTTSIKRGPCWRF